MGGRIASGSSYIFVFKYAFIDHKTHALMGGELSLVEPTGSPHLPPLVGRWR